MARAFRTALRRTDRTARVADLLHRGLNAARFLTPLVQDTVLVTALPAYWLSASREANFQIR